ncbi:MAG TPA: NrfD/PsrC family molybdoenzyme membrane anchor subunit [Streptosporangiaceae bacterium]|nr:NrfD/PsrC family molybdoenzyme membrane anchor subunit [Streptosporangiaceae bacterium]
MSEQPQVPPAEFSSYYGRPILKVTRWREPHLPAYLFLGELSGAAAVLGVAAGLTRRPGLVRAGRLVAAAAAAGGAAFLTAELGRPERFLHMLRVAKPTSPMSMGSWILVSHSGLTSAAAASDLTGLLGPLGTAAAVASAITGSLLAAYPGVLLADTAVPAWHSSYRELPLLFAGGALTAAAAAGLVAGALTGDPASLGPAQRLALVGAALEGGAELALERRSDIAAEPYQEGDGARLLRYARIATISGAVTALAARRSRPAALAAAALLAGGGICAKFAVHRAGIASAKDPKYVVATQQSHSPPTRR